MKRGRRFVVVVLLALASVVFWGTLLMKDGDWRNLPLAAASVWHLLPSLASFTIDIQATAALQMFEKGLQQLAREEIGPGTTVEEYMTHIHRYILDFRSPMIKEDLSYSWPDEREGGGRATETAAMGQRDRTRRDATTSAGGEGALTPAGVWDDPARKPMPFNSPSKKTKRILLHSSPPYIPKSTWDSAFRHCPVNDCQFTWKRQERKQADAIFVFAAQSNHLWKLPVDRSHADQVFIFYIMESPKQTPQAYAGTPWNSAFNWTWNYRTDADIFMPINYLKRSTSIPSHDELLQIKRSKTALISWVVSNCYTSSKRENYVKRLRQVVPVDVFGKCGWMNCSRQPGVCESVLKNYLFYLAFENGYCRDYVTEKFYKTFQQDVHAIPVVRGGCNYTRFFPQGTFVDADQFSSEQALGQYLLELSRDDARVVDMLWRKSHLTYHEHGLNDSFCQLCYKLHHLQQFTNTYPDMQHWYDPADC